MLTRRVFAIFRALIVAPACVSLWTYFVPKWIVGTRAFDGPRPLGWIVVAIGAVVGLPCIWQFAWHGFGTPAPWDPPRQLVISGPYRYVRNPMYVGMGVALLGFAIVFPHGAVIFLGELAVAFVLVFALIVVYEEPTLRGLFGADYVEYCRNVRRWIPRLSPWYAPPHLE